MWTHGVAIRPVPAHAVIAEHTIDLVRDSFSGDDDDAQKRLDDAFSRFEATQPELAARLSDVLEERLDETALALGYFLGIAIWLSFEQQFGPRLRRVDATGVRAAQDALELEAQLRADRPGEPLDVEDVVAREQPALMAFVNEHVETALEGGDRAIDVDDVYKMYRTMLVELLCLSHAVAPLPGTKTRSSEVLA